MGNDVSARSVLAADEITTLRWFLHHFRQTLLRQTEGLDSGQLARRLGPSTLTLGGLLAHMAFVENYWFNWVLTGNAADEPWSLIDWETDVDGDFTLATSRSPEELRSLLHSEIERSERLLEAALAAGGLEQLAAKPRGKEHPSLRWILVHLIEEYARHCGHADLIRESVDGRVDL